MRMKIYNFLVNKVPGIKQRYHRFHDGSSGVMKLMSWGYLLLLNLGYHILFLKFLGKTKQIQFYEKKVVPTKISESAQNAKSKGHLSVDEFIDKLKDYDVISFDVFDTLIFRAVAQPADVFYFVGEKLSVLDFRNIRAWAEWDARVKCNQKNGHMELTLEDIWNNLAEDTGLDAKKGMQTEWEAELSLCYANPFMLEVWKRLKALGKKIIIVSDMYLSREHIEELLIKNGYKGFSKVYVSCEYGISKADGKLYKKVVEELSGRFVGCKIIHVGDNPVSDKKNAKNAGFDTLFYPNVNKSGDKCRAKDMSYMVGAAYRGIVNNHIYNGLNTYSMEYEYGYIYGGLFVLGYCSFIHTYCLREKMEKILFLSRDGDILLKAYRLLFPDEFCEYAYLSRKAVTKLMSGLDKHDFFRRFIYHKVNQNYSMGEVLKAMELDELQIDIDLNEKLTDQNSDLLRKLVEDKWDEIETIYNSQIRAARKYYSNLLSGCKKAAAVDIGWAGSGAIALHRLASEVWHLDCDITGIIAGTNTVHNAEPDAAEPLLQSGRLISYLYSQSHNRDLMKKHDPEKGYNVFWELLLSSDTPQFVGFYEGDVRKKEDDVYLNEYDITLRFGQRDVDPKGAAEIQQGILDFVTEYKEHFEKYPYMFSISGRDAYAPLLAAAGDNEKYLHAMEKRFDLEINVV